MLDKWRQEKSVWGVRWCTVYCYGPGRYQGFLILWVYVAQERSSAPSTPSPNQYSKKKKIISWNWNKGCIWTEDIPPHNRQAEPGAAPNMASNIKESLVSQRSRRGLYSGAPQAWTHGLAPPQTVEEEEEEEKKGEGGCRCLQVRPAEPGQMAQHCLQRHHCVQQLSTALSVCCPGAVRHPSHSIKNACILNNLLHK